MMTRNRHNLSGIYIYDKFENEEISQPTCIEDCTEKTLNNWLRNKKYNFKRGGDNVEFYISVIKKLCETLYDTAEQFSIYKDCKKEVKKTSKE